MFLVTAFLYILKHLMSAFGSQEQSDEGGAK